MAPLRCVNITSEDRKLLLRIARDTIVRSCEAATFVHNDDLVQHALTREQFRDPRNSFVTLTKDGGLRGCIGSSTATYPLPLDVARNAFNSAFRDPRFPALTPDELAVIIIEIAVLTPLQAIPVDTEADLLSELRPYIDGLTIEDGNHRATFLPKVWEQLSDPRDFLAALKNKAGLRPDHWSTAIKAYRYHAESFCEHAEDIDSDIIR